MYSNAQPTMAPTMNDMSTMAPTMNDDSTMPPTMNAQSTMAPTMNDMSTMAPTMNDMSTMAPTMNAKSTVAPTINAKSTIAPTTNAKTTIAPTMNTGPQDYTVTQVCRGRNKSCLDTEAVVDVTGVLKHALSFNFFLSSFLSLSYHDVNVGHGWIASPYRVQDIAV